MSILAKPGLPRPALRAANGRESLSLPQARLDALLAALARIASRCMANIGALVHDCDANVTLISAAALIPTLFGLGFAIDYARAEMLQSRIDAVADAAALTATDSLYIQQTASVAQAAATQVFTSQVTDYADFSFNVASQLTVQITTAGALNLGRTVYVGWIGQSTNMFSGVLGASAFAISGSSTAYATQAPNMNFFLVMDKSPSMLLPTTSTGISQVQGATSDACAFACHQQFPGAGYVKDVNGKSVFIAQNFYTSGASGYQTYYLVDSSNNLYNSAGTSLGSNVTVYNTATISTLWYKSGTTYYSITGYYADGYWLTQNYTSIYPSGTAVDLRVNDETAAAQALIPYAVSEEAINSVAYQLQFFTYDWTHPAATSPVTQYGSMADVSTLSSSSVPNIASSEDWWVQNNEYSTTYSANSDAATETYNMLTSMNAVMPAPGSGATASSPQEVLLIITDGVSDEIINGGRIFQQYSSTGLLNDQAACTTIKNRGIKIAILYTVYDPAVIANDGWSVSNVSPHLPNVLPALQTCASTASDGSSLVYSVTSGQSISTALQTLFDLTLVDSHLVG